MFSGNTCEKCAGGIQGHPHGIFWRLHVLYQQYVLTVLFFNGLCTSNMFMVFQVVVLWLYMSDKFRVICLITKIYLSTKIFFIGGWGGRGLTSTLCICIVLL